MTKIVYKAIRGELAVGGYTNRKWVSHMMEIKNLLTWKGGSNVFQAVSSYVPFQNSKHYLRNLISLYWHKWSSVKYAVHGLLGASEAHEAPHSTSCSSDVSRQWLGQLQKKLLYKCVNTKRKWMHVEQRTFSWVVKLPVWFFYQAKWMLIIEDVTLTQHVTTCIWIFTSVAYQWFPLWYLGTMHQGWPTCIRWSQWPPLIIHLLWQEMKGWKMESCITQTSQELITARPECELRKIRSWVIQQISLTPFIHTWRKEM